MPTNEERREVAARLRNYANLRESFKESPICAFINALGFGGYLDWKGVCSRIADLIEPEPVCIANINITDEQVEKIKSDVLKELEQPERTCEFDSQVCGKIRCKRCGAFVSVDSVWDCSGCVPIKYCPNCGAKAVSDD